MLAAVPLCIRLYHQIETRYTVISSVCVIHRYEYKQTKLNCERIKSMFGHKTIWLIVRDSKFTSLYWLDSSYPMIVFCCLYLFSSVFVLTRLFSHHFVIDLPDWYMFCQWLYMTKVQHFSIVLINMHTRTKHTYIMCNKKLCW